MIGEWATRQFRKLRGKDTATQVTEEQPQILTRDQVVELGARTFAEPALFIEVEESRDFIYGNHTLVHPRMHEIDEARTEAGRIVDLFADSQWSRQVDRFYTMVEKTALEKAHAADPEDFYKNFAYRLEELRAMHPYERAAAFFTRELDGPVAAALNAIDITALGLGDSRREERSALLTPPTITYRELARTTPTDISPVIEVMKHLPTLLNLPPTTIRKRTLLNLRVGQPLQETHLLGAQQFALTLNVHNPLHTDTEHGVRNVPHLTLTVNKRV